jgi:hypothetical protein
MGEGTKINTLWSIPETGKQVSSNFHSSRRAHITSISQMKVLMGKIFEGKLSKVILDTQGLQSPTSWTWLSSPLDLS